MGPMAALINGELGPLSVHVRAMRDATEYLRKLIDLLVRGGWERQRPRNGSRGRIRRDATFAQPK